MSVPVAILAGGLATRLGDVTRATPKVLVEVAGQPFALHQLRLLREAGFPDVVYLTGHLGDQIEAALGDGSRYGMRLRYASDGPVALGTGGAIAHALDALGDRFLVLYGDSYLECDYGGIARAFEAAGLAAAMTVYRNDNGFDRSNVEYAGGRIVAYSKRAQTSAMRYIDYGLGAFRAAAFDDVPRDRSVELADVYANLLARGQLAGIEVTQRFYEVGSPAGLTETHAYLSATLAGGH